MITNADITIYNHKYDKDTRLDNWYRTVIYGVHFYASRKVQAAEAGLNGADVYKIRIPEDADCKKEYIQEDEYMARQEVSGLWTLQNGDYIVLGVCEQEIEKPSDLQDFHKKTCKITSWSDNRFGGLPHWRIGGE